MPWFIALEVKAIGLTKMVLILLVSVVLLCSLVIIYYRNVYVYNKNLKRFPCPPEVPILGHALDFLAADKGFLDVLMHYSKTYGDIVRVKTGLRQLLLITNYDFCRFILTNTKILKKSIDYRYFQGWLGLGLLTSQGVKWKKHRQIITPTFHYNILEEFVDIFESNAKILIKKIEDLTDQTAINVYDLVNLCTLDIICESAMGTSVNAQKNVESEYVQSVKDMLDIVIERVFAPHKAVDWIYYFTKDYQKEQKALKVIHSYTWEVIERRQQALQKNGIINTTKKRKAFLDLLLEINRKNGEQLTLQEIREEVDTFMFAGHDTTGTAICFILYCLANHAEEQAKVLEEQREIFGEDFERDATFQDLKNMKYLELVIKESIRLYPPAPFYSRELDHDVEYEGTILPKGLTLTIFSFAVHRNPEYFPEPERFQPSRFENIDGTKPFAYLPFSAGSRNCIGQKFAMAEMKSVVSRLVRSFDLLPAIPRHDLKLASQTILISSNGVCIQFRKRKLT